MSAEKPSADKEIVAQRIAQLTSEKRALLERLLQDRGVDWKGIPSISKRRTDGAAPLSFAQQRMWFLDRLDGGNPVYHIHFAFRVSGSIDGTLLERCFNRIVERHEVLRTRFVLQNGEPVQVSEPVCPLRIATSDLRDRPRSEVVRAADELTRQVIEARFDLNQGPLLRVALIRLAEQEHLLVVVLHHIVGDLISVGVLMRELTVLYRAFLKGEPDSLEDLPIQYADYAVWQRTWLQGKALQSQLDYWKTQLAGASSILPLPTDRPHPTRRTYAGGTEMLVLPKALSQQLVSLGRRTKATLFMTMLTGFNVLLQRYTGQSDILLGSPIASRPIPETHHLIGLFINSLVMRTDLKGDPTFLELIGRVRKMALAAYDHQHLPFEKLVEALQPERNLIHNPYFQVIFTLQNLPPLQLTDLELTPMTVGAVTTSFDLEVHWSERPDGLAAKILYNTDVFERSSIVRMLGHYRTLLNTAAARPDLRISELPLLTSEERHTVLEEWGRNHAPIPDASLAELFERQVGRDPGAVAVVNGAQRITYGELNQRANRLAHYLQKRGVGPDVLVGVWMERGIEWVVALVGIIKAGGAYLPMDVVQPMERLGWMLTEGRVKVLISPRSWARRLMESQSWQASEKGSGPEVLSLEEEWERIEREGDQRVESGVRPENLAYVIYTSGSSGRPKGVSVTQVGVKRLVWESDYVRLGPEQVMGQVSNASFDAATFEIWGALLNGARLAVIGKEDLLSVRRFGERLREEGVTVMFLTAAFFNQVAQVVPGAFLGFKQLLVGGEALDPKWVKEVQEKGRPERLLNGYGPTETTTFAICHWLKEFGEGLERVPIGKPIRNTEGFVLDEWMNPVPIGVVGELYLGGEGLARGYLNRADLTAERFVPHPFSEEGGQRLYRTGDLCRYREDGVIEYVGRNDEQVKIRGFRIELGEVEAVMRQQAGVKEAVAIVREDQQGEKRLVGYVVVEAGAEVDVGRLRQGLKGKLPEYMVPSALVRLEALPLTANGKVDRRGLPEPPEQAGVEEYEGPRTELEGKIAGVWAEVLGRERVGVEDNFFDLGGHSLLLVRVHSQLSQWWKGKLSIVELFEYPTVRSLAGHLSRPASGSKERGRGAKGREWADGIAIIGMAGRFPGAKSVEEFWENLREGRETIRQFRVEELLAAGMNEQLVGGPNYVKARGVLEGVELFDAEFFGYNPREAELMDPQQRIFLECAWTALEGAGYGGENTGGAVGVYGGVSLNTYVGQLSSHPELLAAVGGFQTLLGSDKDFLPTRVSYKMNLKGPSVTVQTACSTSLVAVHLACKALLGGECEMALAGGVSVSVPQERGYEYQEGGIGSPDGHCRPFDEKAQGTVGGNGVGVVVLKRLAAAQAEGDRIWGVIKGSAINNDGAVKVGYTAPSVEGQAEVIAMAQAAGGVEAESISYVEGHGTGTALGDPIEVEALKQAFGTSRRGYCALGSVKSNVGHLDAAAGVAGLIKTVLALEHGQIPASLNYEQANGKIDFEGSPFYVNGQLRGWEREGGQPRRAGVSSFGIGGTNAHVVVEEGPGQVDSGAGRAEQVLVYSARSEGALEGMRQSLIEHLEKHPEEKLADVAYTLGVGRRGFEHRAMVVSGSREQALAVLGAGGGAKGRSGPGSRRLMWLLGGEGLESLEGVQGLYEQEAVYRERVRECARCLEGKLGFDLSAGLGGGGARRGEGQKEAGVKEAREFAVAYGLVGLWESWGIKAEGMVGVGVGEYVAGYLAGVFGLEEALELVVEGGGLKRMAEDLDEQKRAVALGEYEQRLRRLSLKVPRQRYVSGVAGQWMGAEAQEVEHWVKVWREGVRWEECRAALGQESGQIYVEIGEGLGQRLAGAGSEQREVYKSLGTGAGSALGQMVESLGCLWLGGVKVDWAGYYAGQRRQRLKLPTYPFQRQKYWVESRKQTSGLPLQIKGQKKIVDISQWFNVPGWRSSIRPEEVQTSEESRSYLFFIDSCGVAERLIRRLEAKGNFVIRVTAGKRFTHVSEGTYAINPCERGDYSSLLTEIESSGRIFDNVIHLWSVCRGKGNEDWATNLERIQDLGFYSLMYLAQALGSQKRTDPLQIRVITNQMQEFGGEAALFPEKATVLGVCKVIGEEYPNIECTCIDFEHAEQTTNREETTADELFREITGSASEFLVALRVNHRWVRSIERCPLRPPTSPPELLREDGTYLVTGGLGGIGLELAELLVRAVHGRLVLLTRHKFPAKTQWKEWLASHAESDKTGRRINRLLELEALGGEIVVTSADVTNYEQMQEAIRAVEVNWGTIHGVIHAAGVAGGGLLQMKSRAGAAGVLDPKVKGTLVLEQIFRDRPLDFMLLCSSLTSVLGGAGQSDYCAANAFLDAFAHATNGQRGRRIISVNWDTWREVGMAVETQASERWREAKLDRLSRAISPEEGREVFRRILANPLPQVLVSTTERLWPVELQSDASKSLAKEKLDSAVGANRGPDVSAMQDIEQIICDVCKRVLGVSQIGLDDNLFELGADSLAAVQVIHLLKKEWNIPVAIVNLYEAPTIRLLGERLRNTQKSASELEASERRAETRREMIVNRRRLSENQAETVPE